MSHKPAPIPFGIAIGLLIFLVTFVQLGLLRVAFHKLGLAPEHAYILLFTSLFGSMINIPLFSIKSEATEPQKIPRLYRSLLHQPPMEFKGRTVVAINLGGAVVPAAFSLYLIISQPIGLLTVIITTTIVTLLCRVVSRPVPGIGIGMPIFIAPLSAALIALIFNPDYSAALAYISGTIGVLIGADLLRLNDIRKIGTPIASIGGAGTFDGIFITGIIAVLLA